MSTTTYGVTPQGYVAKPFEEFLAEINAALQAAYGSTIDLSPSQPFGLLAGLLATQFMQLDQLAQAVYTARDPNGAEGAGLIELASITGTVPVTPTQSVASVILTGTSGTVIPTAQTIAVQTAGTQFTTQSAVTLTNATAWAQNTYYTAESVRSANGNIYLCTTPGTSASTGTGPSGTGTAISDGASGTAAVWTYVGTGTATGTCNANSVDYGPVQALAGTLTVISTPVAGWSSVYNALDATLGTAVETDTQFRQRRQQELAASGNATDPGIQSQLIKLTTSTGAALLTSASVFDNPTDTTDGFGLPPHSLQAIVYYPGAPITTTDQAVAQLLFNTKAAGIATYGAQSKTVVDANGYSHVINFDYPTIEWLWVTVNITAHSASYPGNSVVQEVITNYASGQYANFPGYGTGSTVYVGPLIGALSDNVGGFLDASVTIAVTASGGGPPSSYTTTPQVMARNQLPAFDASRITVNVTLV